MELARRSMSLVNRVINNDWFIDICLLGSFVGLGVRSMNQEKLIETLEAEKESLTNTNKSIKNFIWDSKHQLYAEASSSESPIVPLSRLKSIYGELVSLPSSGDAEETGDSSATLII